jgi:hypothetical protein
MGNIYDYLDWRGDLSFKQDDFNEVDNLVLSVLCYNDFSGIVPAAGESGHILLKDAALRFKETKTTEHLKDLPFLKDTPVFLERAAATKRFGELKLSGYVDQIDIERAKQFSAMVFTIFDDLHFIAFRGTDDSIAGWKEDLQMSFKDEVHSQREAVKYTKWVMENYSGEFYLGGHSKGGNLAVYASANMEGAYRESIVEIYNNDGPGFQPKVVETPGYQAIIEKIVTFLPESSIIGMLLEHGEEYYVVKSSGLAMYQHNPFLWEIMGNEFIYKSGLSKEGININKAVRSWLTKLSNEDRERFVNTLFDILQGTGAKSLSDLNNEKINAADAMIKALKTLDKETQRQLRSTIDLLIAESHKTILKSITNDITNIIKFGRKKIQRKGIQDQ